MKHRPLLWACASLLAGSWACVPDFQPCRSDADCRSGDLCVDGECQLADCLDGSACVRCPQPTGEICDGLDNDCDGEADEGLLNACGRCEPTPQEICDAIDNDCDGETDEQLLNACGACGPTPVEVCDSFDNDCDGEADEGLLNACDGCEPIGELGSPCSPFGDESCAMAGALECANDGSGAAVCRPSTMRNTREDRCDGRDDDCDGAVDELLGGSAGLPGVCRGLNLVCDANGMPVPPSEEMRDALLESYTRVEELNCDGLDNDCDGSIDEGEPPLTTNQTGACEGARQRCCNQEDLFCCPDGQACEERFGFYEPGSLDDWRAQLTEAGRDITLYEVAETSCDGVDNDCDGATDQDDPDLRESALAAAVRDEQACPTAITVCRQTAPEQWEMTEPNARDLQRQAMRADSRGEPWVAWEPEERSCHDRIDNDCDGDVDTDAVAPPSDLRGVCVGQPMECGANGWRNPSPAELTGRRIEGYEELEASCDGADNDCDGHIDQFADERTPRAALSGVCEELGVTQVCDGVSWRDPTRAERADAHDELVTHEAELVTCDGRDNDCDGAEDEGIVVSCWPNRLDEDSPLRPADLSDDQRARLRCTVGVQACRDGAFGPCSGVPPRPEACGDGYDDNCDGVVNEGCSDGPCADDDDCPGASTCMQPAVSGGRCMLDGGCGCYACFVHVQGGGDIENQDCAPCRANVGECMMYGGECTQLNRGRGDTCLARCDADADEGVFQCRPGWRCVASAAMSDVTVYRLEGSTVANTLRTGVCVPNLDLEE